MFSFCLFSYFNNVVCFVVLPGFRDDGGNDNSRIQNHNNHQFEEGKTKEDDVVKSSNSTTMKVIMTTVLPVDQPVTSPPITTTRERSCVHFTSVSPTPLKSSSSDDDITHVTAVRIVRL